MGARTRSDGSMGLDRERSLSIWPGVVAAIAGGALRIAIEIGYGAWANKGKP